jgi:selenide,water dikinase
VLKRLPRPRDPNLLVGFETSDDAGVYRLTDEIALVQTVDFLTPIADDPRIYGQIAAANSLSDVYAMGGRPLSALSVLGFPASGAPDLLEDILRGGVEKMNEAGCTIVGGHSIRDEELKFGYAVTGVIHPSRIWRNVGAQAGDALILTKPLGTGVIATALKQGRAKPAWVDAGNESMTRLNRDAADGLHELEGGVGEAEGRPQSAAPARSADGAAVHAVTDITGFGLLGHAREMALGSAVSMRIEHKRIEYLPGAIEAARERAFSGGLKNNRDFLEGCVGFSATVPEEFRALLLDPQTSGGLLASVHPKQADEAIRILERKGVRARRIGEILGKGSPLIEIV